jgi:hypothetical protein
VSKLAEPQRRDEDSTEAGQGSDREADRPRRALVLTLSVLWIIGATGLQLLRQEGVPATDSLWAEDGHLFLTAALTFDHPVELFVAPAGKYMHAVPRTLATIAARIPLDQSALFFALASSLIVAALSLFVFHASRPVIEPWPARAVVAGAMVLLPAAGTEVLNNAANLHYFLTFAAFWALLSRPQSWMFASVAALIVLATAMSDPITVLLAPIAGWTLLRRAEPRRAVIAIAFLVGLVAHGLVWMSADRLHRYANEPEVPFEMQQQLEIRAFAPQSYSESDFLDLPRLYGLRVAGSFFAGDDLLAEGYLGIGDVLAFAGLALILALLGYGLWRRSKKRGWLILLFMYSVLFFGVPVGIRGSDHLAPIAGELTFAGSRYTIVPTLLLISLAAVVLAIRDPRLSPRVWRGVQALAVVAFLALVLADFRDPNPRSGGPRWSEGVADARAACTSSPGSLQQIDVAPLAGFNVLVSCDRLLPVDR